MQRIETSTPYGNGVVNNFASIIDHRTLEQAKMLARHPLVDGPVALMPDAHLGIGATVGSVIRTDGGVIPAAVGVDIGCGVIAVNTYMRRDAIDVKAAAQFIRENLPAGVGQGRQTVLTRYQEFLDREGMPRLVALSRKMATAAASQFGTLGAGNHFAELATDVNGAVWALVHSGSRGVGNQIAQAFISEARTICQLERRPLEHMDLAYLTPGDKLYDYLDHMRWAQAYAYSQREAMMEIMLRSIGCDDVIGEIVNCHHNYTVTMPSGAYLTRKGAIDASDGVYGVIPGSMGADTYVVRGLGDPDSHNSSPHGAGRLMARGAAKRTLDVEKFKQQMTDRGVLWQDRDAQALLDEAPGAYKPIDKVMADAVSLVTPVARLTQFLNFKGL